MEKVSSQSRCLSVEEQKDKPRRKAASQEEGCSLLGTLGSQWVSDLGSRQILDLTFC